MKIPGSTYTRTNLIYRYHTREIPHTWFRKREWNSRNAISASRFQFLLFFNFWSRLSSQERNRAGQSEFRHDHGEHRPRTEYSHGGGSVKWKWTTGAGEGKWGKRGRENAHVGEKRRGWARREVGDAARGLDDAIVARRDRRVSRIS